MGQIKEHPKLLLKKLEELYCLTKAGLAQQVAQFDSIEAKVSRYFTLVAFVLALTAVGTQEFVQIAKNARAVPAASLLEYAFLLSYLLLSVSTVGAIIAYALALRFERFEGIPMNTEMLAHFEAHRYVDVLQSLSKGNIAAFKRNSTNIGRKVACARWGYRLTIIALITGVVATVFHAALSYKSVAP